MLRNFVNGGSADATSGAVSDVVDPSTGEAYAQAPVQRPADVDAALRAAATAFETWRDTTPAERSLALLRFADAIEARAADLTAAESKNTGKPVEMTRTTRYRHSPMNYGSSRAPREYSKAAPPGSTSPSTPR